MDQYQHTHHPSSSDPHKITTVNDPSTTAFRIRKEKPATPKQTQQRIPTVYGMPKIQAKALPKIDKPVQLPSEVITTAESQSNVDEMLKTMTKFKLEGQQEHVQSPNVSFSQQKSQIKDDLKNQEEEKEVHAHSRISTAKSTTSNVSQKSLAHQPSEMSLLFDPNELVEDKTVIAQLVKTNITLLQRCLASSNKALFLAAIENIKNVSNNFGPALNKHLPIILGLIKKKQDLASIQRIHELKEALIINGGEEAEQIVLKFNLK